MADVLITEYTDPACPWAYSAEPFRQRLNWLYGERLEWQVRMVVLSESVAELEERGFGVEQLSAGYRKIACDHGMPIDTSVRPRMATSRPACEAVVAARLHAPEKVRPLLRALRVRNFAGELLDAPETIAGAASDAGLDYVSLGYWMAGEDVQAAVESDKALARAPMPAARVLDHKLANWSGGMRYTCPSYEIVRKSDGVRIAVPGFQPFAVYDTILANLVPDLGRRVPPSGVTEVLEWAGFPLASKEVAVVAGMEVWEAREALGRVATERHIGADGFWSLT
ncbi:DsbA family oxidoreductase [Solirubrobacter soli]|uniref:DsbA family oxidoreductase n=1 Tax=Solirubrobacter soli TaxID=363832 RepID=UPI0003F7BABA|nr:DsbA family protein [Solirubrobacter soli]